MEIVKKYLQFRSTISELNKLKILRWLGYKDKFLLQLHLFCDASEKAYAGAVYLRTINNKGNIEVRLIAAKTRATPIKQITLPRPELCAASLATKLLVKYRNAPHFTSVDTFGWTDSTIVLSWLFDSPKKWKNFMLIVYQRFYKYFFQATGFM